MINLDQLNDNDVWLAVKISGSFIFINDTPYYVFVLMDAVSANVFGHVIVEAFGGAPDTRDVESLFKKAYAVAKRWPGKLVISDKSVVSELFRSVAHKHGVETDTIPLNELSPVIEPFVEEFANRYK